MRHPPSSRTRGKPPNEPKAKPAPPKRSEPQKDGAALPLIPAELGIDPGLSALLHTTACLDLAEDDVVNPDVARAALERVGLYVQRLDDAAVERVAAELDRLLEHAEGAGWPEAARDFVRDFLAHCGFEVEEDAPPADDEE